MTMVAGADHQLETRNSSFFARAPVPLVAKHLLLRADQNDETWNQLMVVFLM
jgi:hypothetical protein